MNYGPGGWYTPVSSEEAHGDAWFARIRARHLELGARCPCGNGVDPCCEQQHDPQLSCEEARAETKEK